MIPNSNNPPTKSSAILSAQFHTYAALYSVKNCSQQLPKQPSPFHWETFPIQPNAVHRRVVVVVGIGYQEATLRSSFEIFLQNTFCLAFDDMSL